MKMKEKVCVSPGLGDGMHGEGIVIPILSGEDLEDALVAYCYEVGADKAELADIEYSDCGKFFMALINITQAGWEPKNGFRWNEKRRHCDWVYGETKGYEANLFYTHNIFSLFRESQDEEATDHRKTGIFSKAIREEGATFFLKHSEITRSVVYHDVEPAVIAEWRRELAEVA